MAALSLSIWKKSSSTADLDIAFVLGIAFVFQKLLVSECFWGIGRTRGYLCEGGGPKGEQMNVKREREREKTREKREQTEE